MKKVILLSGSPNLKGNTMQIFNKMAEVIKANGIEAEIISLAGMNIYDTMVPAQLKAEDGFDAIIEKVKEAEGLIVGGPVYWGVNRPQLMTALHRIAMSSRQNGGFLAGKVGGPISVARRAGQTSSIQEALMFYLYNDMVVVGSTYWNVVFGKNAGEALEDEEGMKTVLHFADHVAKVINKLFD